MALWAKMGLCGRVLDEYTDLDLTSGISKKNNNAYSADYNTEQQIAWELSKVILGLLWGSRYSLQELQKVTTISNKQKTLDLRLNLLKSRCFYCCDKTP